MSFFADTFAAKGYLAEHNNEDEEWFQTVLTKVVRVFEELTDEDLAGLSNAPSAPNAPNAQQ